MSVTLYVQRLMKDAYIETLPDTITFYFMECP